MKLKIYEHEGLMFPCAVIDDNVEGWKEVMMSDGSKVVVRPSRLTDNWQGYERRLKQQRRAYDPDQVRAHFQELTKK